MYIDLDVGRGVSIVVAVTVVVVGSLEEGNCLVVILVERLGSEDVCLREITGVLLI